MLAEFGALSAEQVAALAASKARNRRTVASRWAREGRIFGVPQHGRTVYLASRGAGE